MGFLVFLCLTMWLDDFVLVPLLFSFFVPWAFPSFCLCGALMLISSFAFLLSTAMAPFFWFFSSCDPSHLLCFVRNLILCGFGVLVCWWDLVGNLRVLSVFLSRFFCSSRSQLMLYFPSVLRLRLFNFCFLLLCSFASRSPFWFLLLFSGLYVLFLICSGYFYLSISSLGFFFGRFIY